jgi:AbiV family abortive infection protein
MLDVNTFATGAQLAFENSLSLFEAAVILEQQKKYPIANSLLVLAAEEASKAYVIRARDVILKDGDETFNGVFKSHDIKIDFIRGHRFLSIFFNKMLELELEPLIRAKVSGEDITPEAFTKTRKEGFQQLLKWLKDETYEKTDLNKELGWWRNVKDEKERGFYVGFKRSKWTSPNNISRKHYLNTKRYVSNYISIVKESFEIEITRQEFDEYKKQFLVHLNL